MAELVWQLDAITDLDEIASYIARQSPDFAPIFVERIVQSAERLADQPLMGRVIPEIGDDNLRELIFQNYRIAYWTTGGRVTILGILHSALDFTRMAGARGWYLT